MNKSKYDFILFEHLYNVENHYKDLVILANLLQKAGYKVAIADVFKEAKLCKVDNIPHISLDIDCPKGFRTLKTYNRKRSGWVNLYYRIRKDIYIYKILKKLKGMASNIYIGSLTLATPAFFFTAFDKNTNYFMWALRSAHVLNWKNDKIGLYHFISKALYRNIHKYKKLNLIVSNDLIKEEFVELVGMDVNRLILRPERVIKKKQLTKGKGIKAQSLSLLYIGTLRASKNVEFCIEAIKRLNDRRITYTIAGRCKSDNNYNEKIKKAIKDIPNIIRIDRYIPDEEYEELMRNCDCLVLCDNKEKSCASNGTMIEALLQGKPIIAPDYDPFKYEIEKYGVGMLYRYNDVDSLCEIISTALNDGVEHLKDNIASYQENFIEDNVVQKLTEQFKKNEVF